MDWLDDSFDVDLRFRFPLPACFVYIVSGRRFTLVLNPEIIVVFNRIIDIHRWLCDLASRRWGPLLALQLANGHLILDDSRQGSG